MSESRVESVVNLRDSREAVITMTQITSSLMENCQPFVFWAKLKNNNSSKAMNNSCRETNWHIASVTLQDR